MTRRFGADSSPFQNLSLPLVDDGGRIVVSTDDTYGGSPMGISLREQVLFGLPNATFNLLPPDPAAEIDETNNPLPFWSIQTTPNITATPLYNSTTQTWGIKIDPGTAPSGDYLTLKTRSWVSTDDNLALRQKASLTMIKNGTYAGASQWNLTLTAEYFGQDNLSLGSYAIGTVFDNTTWTSISGTTTAGGSAISASASWVEFTVKLTATANITSSTSATLQSLLVATSAPAGVFVVTETFNASGTWTRPTGVTSLVAVVGVGGGGGGASGSAMYNNTVNADANAIGGPSGGSSSWAIIRDLYIGDVSSVSVGIGTAGVGGSATTLTKAAAVTTMGTAAIVTGGAGGATTFGTYLTIPGGGGGGTAAGGTAGGAPTSTMYGIAFLGSVAGTLVVGSGNIPNGAAGSASTFAQLPYWQSFASGTAGGSATNSLNTVGTATTTAGGVAGSAGIIGGGGGGGSARYNSGNDTSVNGAGGVGGYGAGSGGGASAVRFTAISTAVSTGGAGGNAAPNSGAGGGGGGGANITAYPKSGSNTNYNASVLTVTPGAGGNGGAGRLYVVYVA